MTQLKIIDIRGQCRGRPPTRAPNKDGPLTAGQTDGWTVDSLSAANNRQPAACWQRSSARGSPFLARGPGTIDPFGVKQRRSKKTGLWISKTENRKPKIENRKSKILTSLARDWPTYTCSVSQNIAQNRDNDRSTTALAPGKEGVEGKLCPETNDSRNGGTVEWWNGDMVEP